MFCNISSLYSLRCVTWPGGLWLKRHPEKSVCRRCPLWATVAPRVRVKHSGHLEQKPLSVDFCSFQHMFTAMVIDSVCPVPAGPESVRRMTCGQGTGLCISTPQQSEETQSTNVPSVRESAFWSRFCCVNALLLICINVFLYAYFAWVENHISHPASPNPAELSPANVSSMN